ncbi:MAG TPA: molybdenum cofactor biosynthesis protein MoaE [Acidimicrobiia bacterium]|nr:molybdenum cofactor biosynthesis protein MoaE [Acidimicrobiia bacterium]
MRPPDPPADDWIELSKDVLPTAEAIEWATLPSCGGVVCFAGTVRDSSEDRPGVTALTYEAYEEQAVIKLQEVADECRRRVPDTVRLVLLHRTGRLELTEASVIVVASAPHRAEAFEAARYCIDTLKETVPIWKAEDWEGGSDWALGEHEIRPVTGS